MVAKTSRKLVTLWFGLLMCVHIQTASVRPKKDQNEAIQFLKRYNKEFARLTNLQTIASWNYSTNITDENAAKRSEAGLKVSDFKSKALKEADAFDTSGFSEEVQRQFEKLGSKPLEDQAELEELSNAIADMGKVYGSAKVCFNTENQTDCHGLSPKLGDIMASSTDYDERTFVWKEWRRLTGAASKPNYMTYVTLKNKEAKLNGYQDYGDQWRSEYEMDDFEGHVIREYKKVEPLYKELHAYVRRNLANVYGEDKVSLNGSIPASLLGDMWGRFWNALYPLMIPYPDSQSIDPSEEMENQNYTVERMFEKADDFYASMGLLRVPESFWRNSMLRKPEDGREVICHATAWDFYDGKDFRIRMCASDYSFGDFKTIFHELGHTQYQQQYAHQPMVFRDGANPGFHEAIGELMGLTAATPKYLYKTGLSKELIEDDEQDINFLFSQALERVSNMPFYLVMDLWRWKLFRGEYPDPDQWNDEFWKLKQSMSGIKSPVQRSKDDLDPITIYHVNQDYDMIRYFTRTMLMFQFAEALCEISGHEGPLHRCDFSGSKEAGKALADMLKLGSSKPWQEAMEQLTGTREMTADAMVNFFEPLHQWLKEKNAENGDQVGWNSLD